MGIGPDDEPPPDPTIAELPWFDGSAKSLTEDLEPAEKATVILKGEANREPPQPEAPRARLQDRGQLAAGGLSVIRRVFDRSLYREVAMKVLLPKLGPWEKRQMALEEAQITGQLEHPNIVPVYDLCVQKDGSPVFTMKLVEGKTFHRVVVATDPRHRSERELRDLIDIFLKVCDAVSFAHSRGVIHRDLKPENVMVGGYGQVYVMDWGCALLRGGHRSVNLARAPFGGNFDNEGAVVGTAAYMSPEQAHGRIEQVDEQSDVFALGAMLYHVLTLRPPYEGKTPDATLALARAGRVVPPQERYPGLSLPPALCDIAMRALDGDRKRRYLSVLELKEDVVRVLAAGLWYVSRTFAEGRVVFSEGDEADAAYIITSGECEAYRVEDGRKVVLRTMGPGEVFGETAIFAAQPRSAAVVATTELVVVVITRDAFEGEMSRESWMGAFVRSLAERFRELDTRLSQLRRAGTTP